MASTGRHRQGLEGQGCRPRMLHVPQHHRARGVCAALVVEQGKAVRRMLHARGPAHSPSRSEIAGNGQLAGGWRTHVAAASAGGVGPQKRRVPGAC
eukprot:352712-Chlamydomonas_euryale.AAC.3